MVIEFENGVTLVQGVDFELMNEDPKPKDDGFIWGIKFLSEKAWQIFEKKHTD